MEELFQQSILLFFFSTNCSSISFTIADDDLLYSSKVVVCEREMDLGCSEGGVEKAWYRTRRQYVYRLKLLYSL